MTLSPGPWPLRRAISVLACLWSLTVHAQSGASVGAAAPDAPDAAHAASAPPPANAPAAPAFDVQIDAPPELAALLGQHLQLLRYRELTDLSSDELDRLIDTAQTDAAELLATQGYFKPQVIVRRDGAAQPPRVRVQVVPGDPVRVGQVNLVFSGAIATDDDAAAQRQTIRDRWALPSGAHFTQSAWDKAKNQALGDLTTHAYPLGQLAQSWADVDTQAGLVQLQVVLDSGPLFRNGDLAVSGLERYEPTLVQRLARIPMGAPYDLRELVSAQQRLAASGYFDAAFVSLVPQSEPARSLILANLREAPLQKLTLGAGASTDAGARLSVEHLHQRLPGLGWRAQTALTLERDNPAFSTDWLGTPRADQWRGLAGLQVQTQTLTTGRTRSQRLRLGGIKKEEAIDRAIYTQFDRADTPDASTNAQAVSVHYALTLRRFDALPVARSGWGLGLEVGAGRTLGAQAVDFVRGLARGQAYWPLSSLAEQGWTSLREGRLALRAQLGAVLARDGSQLPFTQLFLTGGDNTVRGYPAYSIGVTRPNGSVVAGRFLTAGSLEYQRPIVIGGRLTDWESDVFIDGGAVADTVPQLRAHYGVGTGVRWNSPVGPLQIDLAYGLAVNRWRMHLNVGFVF